MWGTFLSNYKHFSCQSSCLLLLLTVGKNHYRKESISVRGIEQFRDALFLIHLFYFIYLFNFFFYLIRYLKSMFTIVKKLIYIDKKRFKRDLAKLIWITIGSSDNYIFNCYKALYCASSSTFSHLDFIRVVRWVRADSPMLYS